MRDEVVTILLATYNGERFIADQLDSLLQQTYKNWQLLVSDDGSTDKTPAIIEKYRSAHPQRIEVLPNDGINRGSVLNFNRLFLAAKARRAAYVMFCDQDDYWLPGKIERSLSLLLVMEVEKGAHTPLLIHTRFTYVNSDLSVISNKKNFHARKLPVISLATMLIQNPVYGCTMMFNSALVAKINSIPACAENHDFWVSLVASAFGDIVYLPDSMILYRQHGGNISTHHDDMTFVNRYKKIFVHKGHRKDVDRKLVMANAFNDTYKHCLNKEQQQTVTTFISFLQQRKCLLAIHNLQNGVRMQTATQTLLFYLTALLHRRQAAGTPH